MRLTAGLPGPAGELTAIARPPASKGSRWSEKGRNEEMEGGKGRRGRRKTEGEGEVRDKGLVSHFMKRGCTTDVV